MLYTPDFIPLEQKKNKELHMKLSDIDNFLQDNEWIDSTMEQLNCDNQTPYKWLTAEDYNQRKDLLQN